MIIFYYSMFCYFCKMLSTVYSCVLIISKKQTYEYYLELTI